MVRRARKSPAMGGDSWRSGDTTDLGSDSAIPVSDDFGPGSSVFAGRVRLVQIDSPPKTWTI